MMRRLGSSPKLDRASLSPGDCGLKLVSAILFMQKNEEANYDDVSRRALACSDDVREPRP